MVFIFHFQVRPILMQYFTQTENLCCISGKYCKCCRREITESFRTSHWNESRASWLVTLSEAPAFFLTESLSDRTLCRRPTGRLLKMGFRRSEKPQVSPFAPLWTCRVTHPATTEHISLCRESHPSRLGHYGRSLRQIEIFSMIKQQPGGGA